MAAEAIEASGMGFGMRQFIAYLRISVAELWRYRHFWLSLVQMDLRTRYRGSVLGVGWSLVRPIAMTAVICVVLGSALNVNLVEFAPSLLLGLAVWSFLSESVLNGCSAFQFGQPYLRQTRLPLTLFSLRVVLGAAFHFLVTLPVVLVLLAGTSGFPSFAGIVASSVSFVLMFGMGWGLAVLGGLAHARFPDTKHILEIVLQLAFYLTPILYPASVLRAKRFGSLLVEWNPLAAIVEQIREPLLTGRIPGYESYSMQLLLVSTVALLASYSMSRLERQVIFWL